MNKEYDLEFTDFINFFSSKNYEKSRRFGESYIYDPNPLKIFLNELNNPQKEYKTIHIAGTSGKGSAATLMARALGNSCKTGLYTSPHFEKINERIGIQYNHQFEYISNEEFLQLWNSIKEIKSIKDISFFDALTVISMLYFKHKKVEWAVFETGLGGRLDSTNTISPEFCIITPIGMDHQNILGDTIEKITMEKGGIIKKNTPVYAYVDNVAVRNCLDKVCLDQNTKIKYFLPDNNLFYNKNNLLFIKWIYEDFFKKNIPDINDSIKGRLEILSNNPYIIFDSAHNKIAFKELLFWINQNPGKWQIYLNMMRERNIIEIIDLIKSLKNERCQIDIYLYPIEEPGYYESKDFKNISSIKILTHDSLIEKLTNDKCRHLITGSIRMYPKVRQVIKNFQYEVSAFLQ
ncbi:MAG: Mur ligase family protein [Spirochaetia bacterium]|nr:Mur ligase family protein [Spirochaetia bacterium]